MTVESYLIEDADLAGWIRSRLAGILPTVFAPGSVCLITYSISSVAFYVDGV